jgi:hypothetical protein
MASNELTVEYAAKIKPLVPLARKAYGSRSNTSPAHSASEQYTKLVGEYYEKGGSLVALSNELDTTYATLRRRVANSSRPIGVSRKKSRMTPEQIEEAAARISEAKSKSTEAYHAQVADEYISGASLAKIATALKMSSSYPLYYAVEQHALRSKS